MKAISDDEMKGLEQEVRAIFVARPAHTFEGQRYLTPGNVLALVQRCKEAEKGLMVFKEKLQGWLARGIR